MEAFNSTNFNPHTQPLVLTYPDGSVTTFGADEITYELQYGIRITAIFASQIGACGVLAVLMYILGRTQGRQLPLRLLNLLALTLVIVRSCLQISYWTGEYTDFYNYFAYDNTDVPDSERAKSVAAAVLAGLLQLTVLVSLILQLRAIFITPGFWKEFITTFNIGMSALSLGFFFTAVYENSRAIIRDEGYLRDWKHDTAQIIFTMCICAFSFTLFWKLAASIRKRAILNVRQFGPLQILCIGSFQTMLIPAIFCILESTTSFEGLGSLTSTLTAMSLPFSSIWAALDTMAQEAAAVSKWGIMPESLNAVSTGARTQSDSDPSNRFTHKSTFSSSSRARSETVGSEQSDDSEKGY
ncbi:hypothetical protein EX30DRAFT_363691 [Ascodesmis nigricans]|uniref:Pheromone alpha factor receptor n=1 Tax=Ascodesmis nigricans TaxID=341454 RepID=A0A4S2MY79_9PEZI|nr:hypothetical protein EX30DRAFT_363691 [Ascodesmis nigricans]